MMKLLLLLAVIVSFEGTAFATWSVIAIDKNTKKVVVAAASCVNAGDDLLKDALAVVVPGVGAAVCQARADNTHQNQILVFNELKKGTDPRKIIELLSADTAYDFRQYGILDMQGRFAGRSGQNNIPEALWKGGQVPGTDIFYSIQGNTLRPGTVVAAETAFLAAKGELTDRAMAALQAGDEQGGDTRCACPPEPAAGSTSLPCDSKHAHVAFILLANPTDTIDSYSKGKYAMYITVSQPAADHPFGATTGESLNPVKTLRMRYDAWRKTAPGFQSSAK
jgi:uncharacterized Ntn-hydrolase superfamily protein